MIPSGVGVAWWIVHSHVTGAYENILDKGVMALWDLFGNMELPIILGVGVGFGEDSAFHRELERLLSSISK